MYNEITFNTSTMLFNIFKNHIEQSEWVDNWLTVITTAEIDKEIFETLLKTETDETIISNLREAISDCEQIVENINNTEWAIERYKKNSLKDVELDTTTSPQSHSIGSAG